MTLVAITATEESCPNRSTPHKNLSVKDWSPSTRGRDSSKAASYMAQIMGLGVGREVVGGFR
eukprot:CAMPEP_0170065410 /NCGR_PEP_ID=MMETSP0019_2-20121128/5508_1 /TAXON_ID=98059 /ORGANISM="Dinobryon sp., Strain UTEXLB2267" /LENGTH=61 /DNA_ID=CAMNT_0010272273 /DNA_START=88 /DNA_END=273 /DNA_ORIENTATION=-